ncbi:uncharacterized protein [Elaeis guineensis]|uniref:Uncharacterized protein LOC105039580 n=1 Tax=Elaeis guineensis var. tenera TaxID=51953 RepID=A0A6I9QRU5_ELAGV|nr:uncharacterized protein LOC105039580 [Elaeis guineensis]
MAMAKGSSVGMNSSKQSGVMGMLREAMYIPSRNKKLMLPVMLVAFLPSSLLSIGNYISIYPLLLNFIINLYLLSSKEPSTPQFYNLLLQIKEDAEVFVHVDIIFGAASYMVSFFSMMIIVYSSAVIYSGKQLTPKDLFQKIKGTWKRPFVTRIYFTLLFVGYTVTSVCLIAILMLNAHGSMVLIVLGALLALLARLLYVYLGMVWMMGLVISVLEDDCYGMEALEKAGHLVKGRRAQGFLIAVVFLMIDGVLTGGYGFGITRFQSDLVTHQATGLVVLNILLLLKMFSQMVYTVFYYECNKSHGREIQVSGDFTYTRVSVTSSDGEVLP